MGSDVISSQTTRAYLLDYLLQRYSDRNTILEAAGLGLWVLHGVCHGAGLAKGFGEKEVG